MQRRNYMNWSILLVALACVWPARAQEPTTDAALAPPRNVHVRDFDWDDGTKAVVSWELSADDERLDGYYVYKALARFDGVEQPLDWSLVGIAPPGRRELQVADLIYEVELDWITKTAAALDPLLRDAVYNSVDPKRKHYEVGWVFKVVASATPAVPEGEQPVTLTSAEVMTGETFTPGEEWFDGSRFWLMVITIILGGSVLLFIAQARSGKELKVRKIAGLSAVDEAVGRATEMGRSCLFIPGIQDMNDIQTIAGITVLSRVAKTAAEYDARVEVPTSRSLVMTTARETVQAAFLAAGRPDAYNPDNIYYVTDEQFGYVAYLQGMMTREKPAACFYMGTFFAESLILAETGNNIGAIQVAGTAMPAQLPFFVAACDYTLIGEEFFAASAYLSGEPDQLGSLKGQDVGKLIVAIGIVVGVIFATLAVIYGADSVFAHIVNYIRDVMLKGA